MPRDFLLTANVKKVLVSTGVAASFGDVQHFVLDGLGYKSICFNVHFGTITGSGTGTCTVEASNDESTWMTVSGVSVVATSASSAMLVVIDVASQSTYRYYRLSIARAVANVAITSIQADLYGAFAASVPVVDPSVFVLLTKYKPAFHS